MAITKNFETVYTAPKGEKYTVVIGTLSGDVPVGASFDKELEMMAPGLTISYNADPNTSFKPIMASNLSASFKMTHDQYTKWRALMEQPEGDVFVVVYKGDVQDSDYVFWYGHMLPESCVIDIQECLISVQFIDGLASLAYVDWKQNDGTPYDDCNLQVVMGNILKKIPGWMAFYNLHAGNGKLKAAIKEVGLPRPSINVSVTDVPFEGQNMLQMTWIQQRTFVKRKKRTEKWRQLPSDPEFISTYDVLEDVCAMFGCNFFLSRGYYWMFNRPAVLQFDADNSVVKMALHRTTTASPDLVASGNAASTISDLLRDVDDTHDFIAGATETRSIPISGVYMEHEEAGSDLIIAEGVSSLGYDPDLASSLGANFFTSGSPVNYSNASYYIESLHYVLWRWFRSTDAEWDANQLPGYNLNGAARTYYGTGSNLVEWKHPLAYCGYPERKRYALALPGGNEFRIKFSGNLVARSDNPSGKDFWVGAVAVLKLRLQVTHTDGTNYRLKRWVKTHWWDTETQSADGIRINGITSVYLNSDVYYYRKYYDELEWVDQNDADYADAFYEIIIPHGDNNRIESYYGSDTEALDVEYANQTVYTPFHVEVSGDNTGDGVIFDKKVDDERGKYWFVEDLSFTLPDVAGEFDFLDSDWILEMYLADQGPRPNVDPTTLPLWHENAPGGTDPADMWTDNNCPTNSPSYRSSSSEGTFEIGYTDGVIDTGVGWGPGDFDTSDQKYLYPKEFMMKNWAVYLGDGSAESNVLTSVNGGPGFEEMGMTSSRLGSRSTYNHSYTHGALKTKYWFEGSLLPDTNWTSVTSYPKTQLYWVPYKNDETGGAGLTDAYNSLHGLVCSEYMSFFASSNMMVTGSIIARVPGNDSYFGPYQTIQTNKLDGISTLKLVPLSLSWNMVSGTQFTAMAIPSGRYAAVEEYVESNNKGPGGGRKPGALPTGKVMASVSQIRQNRNVGQQNTGNITVIDGKITDLDTAKDDLQLLQLFMDK